MDLELEEVALAYLDRVVGVRVVASLDEVTPADPANVVAAQQLNED